MPEKYFIKLAGAEGESVDPKHKGEIDVLSWSWGASNPDTRASAGGAGASRPQATDFSFVHRVDKASPGLFLAAVSGKRFKDALISSVRSSSKGTGIEYLKFKFTGVVITRVEQTADGAGQALEDVSFNFDKLEMAYTPTSASGKASAALKAGWDFAGNRKL